MPACRGTRYKARMTQSSPTLPVNSTDIDAAARVLRVAKDATAAAQTILQNYDKLQETEPAFLDKLKALRLAKGIPLSVRIARGSPKSLKVLSNTVNA